MPHLGVFLVVFGQPHSHTEVVQLVSQDLFLLAKLQLSLKYYDPSVYLLMVDPPIVIRYPGKSTLCW